LGHALGVAVAGMKDDNDPGHGGAPCFAGSDWVVRVGSSKRESGRQVEHQHFGVRMVFSPEVTPL
ncbi:hypothetical protein, partial [Zoogloea sp.]|uniref:hypothetical protein n=1 Tax=Zoogloea sp. TaxID=49181 RepID=UPI002614073E